MNEEWIETKTYVFKDKMPLAPEQINIATNNLLSNIEIDVYNSIKGKFCSVHPDSKKLVTISLHDDNDITIAIITCCKKYSELLDEIFKNFPYTVSVAYVRTPPSLN